MRSRRLLHSAASLLLAAFVATCSNELEPTGAIAVTLAKGASWPDTIAAAEVATLAVTVTGSHQEAITNLNLQWSTSDSTVVTLTNGPTPLQAIVGSRTPGTATIQVRVSQTGFAPVQFSAPVVVKQRGADSLLAVGDVDTIGLVLNIAPAALGSATVTWSSSDPSILGVAALPTDSKQAVITGRTGGAAQVLASVQSDVGRSTFQLPVQVLPLQILEQPPWSPLVVLSDTATFKVLVQDALGRPRTGFKVQWSSTNETAFAVDSNGVVLAKSRGGGELVATVGAAPFQVFEHRAPLQIVQKWRTVSAGLDHTCAIAALDGTGYCWGSNNAGELGAGLTTGALALSTRPLAIATSHKFNELQVGDAHTCGEEAQVNLFCWGSRIHGALGDAPCPGGSTGCGGFDASEVPVTIVSDGNLDTTQLRIEQLAVGGTFTCILARARFGFISRVRRLRCWGTHSGNDNTDGVTFDSTAATSVPMAPDPLADQTTDYVEVSAGGEHVCNRPAFLYLNFHIECMGMNFQGELGYGPLEYSGWNPIYQYTDQFKLPVGYADTSANAIGEGIPLSGIAAGHAHTCAFDAIGVVCWGSNSSGQLGQPAYGFNGHGYPIRASVSVTLVSLTAGGEHTCGLTVTGAAYCWGSNSNGQLGNGTIGGSNPAAAPVGGGLSFVSLSAGGSHTCGVTADGSIYCWGANASGQLGDGTQTDRASPTRVTEAPQ